MSKHTPGPWEIRRDRQGRAMCIARVGYMPHAMIGFHDDRADDHIAEETHEANARLIAAAPEMIEALKDLVKSRDLKMGPSAVNLRYTLARDLLAKIEGA